MKRKLFMILGIAIMLAGIIFGVYGLKKCIEEENAGEEYEELREEVVIELPETVIPEEEEKEVVIPIDFDALKVKCPDAYAWIEIPGTNINYPLVQETGDNDYYLSHTAEKRPGIAGAIYTEEYNSKEFDDPNTVIYGHNMRNGSMFKHLHKYRDSKFFEQNSEIIIYQPNRILRYRVFASYVYDNRHLMKSFNFHDTKVYESYLKEVTRRAGRSGNLNAHSIVGVEDRIITLSTCTGNDSQRYLVHAVLSSIEEKK